MSTNYKYSIKHFIVKDDVERLRSALLGMPPEQKSEMLSPEALAEGSLLHVAARYGSTTCIPLLLEQGVRIDTKDKKGLEPIHVAMLSANHVEQKVMATVEILLASGANPNARSEKEGITPLYGAAVRKDSSALIEFLVAKGATVDSKDVLGVTPLYGAAVFGFSENVRALLKVGADPLQPVRKKANAAEAAAEHPETQAVIQQWIQAKRAEQLVQGPSALLKAPGLS